MIFKFIDITQIDWKLQSLPIENQLMFFEAFYQYDQDDFLLDLMLV